MPALRGFDTQAIHGDGVEDQGYRALKFPVYAGVAFEFDSAEDLEDAFAYRKPAHVYSRITNPTVQAFEQKINALEQARGCLAVASGMAAIANVFLALLTQGENIVAADSIFGNTYSFFKNTLPNLGIETRFVDCTDPHQIRAAINSQTRVLFLETISNPKMIVPDIAQVVEVAHQRAAAVVVDATVTTPYLLKGVDYGIDVVVHSTTKLISGGATSVGGVIVDTGHRDWSQHPSLSAYEKFGSWAFLMRLRKEVYRDLGACMAPQTAYLQSLGLETLSLRMEKACHNCQKVALFLERHPGVQTVNYPGLPSSVFFDIAAKQFGNRFGSILSFELADKQTAFRFLNRLRIIRRATNLGDNTTLALHPASTIFQQYTAAEKTAMGVSDGLVRLSVGIETVEDLIDDLQQALNNT